MTPRNRREREKLQMRESILQAASNLFTTNGFDKTSIRNIADAIEYSPATIYLYFKDKNAIFFELHQRAFKLFFQQFTGLAHVQDPFERLRALGRIYLEFAFANPELYELMFVMSTPMEHLDAIQESEGWEAGMQSYSFLEETVEACLQSGQIKGKSAPHLTLAMWSLVHGLATLTIKNRLKRMELVDDVDAYVESAYDQMVELLRA